jgi:hypothetical protein
VKPRSREKHRGRKESGTFLRIPTDVLASPNFCALTAKAKALLLDIGARYKGFNNGNLASPWTWMKERGWRSKDTLHRALKELLQAGMIEQTRQGGLHGPSLYAFTWLPIDECKGKLDMAPTRVASGKWNHAQKPAQEAEKIPLPPRSVGRTAPIVGLEQLKRAAK